MSDDIKRVANQGLDYIEPPLLQVTHTLAVLKLLMQTSVMRCVPHVLRREKTMLRSQVRVGRYIFPFLYNDYMRTSVHSLQYHMIFLLPREEVEEHSDAEAD